MINFWHRADKTATIGKHWQISMSYLIGYLGFWARYTLVPEALCKAKETKGEKEESLVTSFQIPLPHLIQSRTQSNACARARMALALGKLTTGTPKFRGSGFVGMHVKPIIAQEKFNFPRANAILARAQALLWVRDCT